MHLLASTIAPNAVLHEPQCNTEHDLRRVYKWEDADYDSINDYLSNVDWQLVLMCNLTVDTLWVAFTEILQSAVDLYVPFYTVKPSGNFVRYDKRHKISALYSGSRLS